MAKIETACKSSGLQTADKLVVTGRCKVYGFVLYNSAATSTLVLYDEVSATGTDYIGVGVNPTSASTINVTFPTPVQCNTGLYADIDGTDANYIVYYVPYKDATDAL